ncbi:hypothetical protein [Ochrobactrum quorumnocens]|uniref:hypothetical protein n=1 Tax=Ochrobactrum quorumnocens TaxID=271865 RepID=UPI003BA25102
MISGSISTFAPPKQDGAPGGGGKRFTGQPPKGPRAPFPARQKRPWAALRYHPHRLLCWMLAVLAAKLASVSYALSRFGVLEQPQTGRLLRLATRLHAKSVRMLMDGSW